MQSQYLDKSGLNKLKTRIQSVLDQLLAHTRNNTVHITQAEREKWNDSMPSDLGELAYKDSASGAYTPAGSVSQPAFTGTAAALTMKGTPAGTVSQPTFTGAPASFSMSGTPAGTVSQPTFTGTPASFSMSGTPTGSVSAPAITVTPTTTSVDTLSAVGTLPSLTFTVTGEDLAIGWSAGTLPTQGSATVMTGASATASAPTFTGDGMDFDVEYTPEGTVSQPTFTGSAMSATASYTPEGTVSQPTFSGSEMSMSASYTPEGTVSQPAFTGTPEAITVS